MKAHGPHGILLDVILYFLTFFLRSFCFLCVLVVALHEATFAQNGLVSVPTQDYFSQSSR
jgi:hypothetical protein